MTASHRPSNALRLTATILVILSTLLVTTASAQLHYIEEFNTDTFLDADRTDAHWNTDEGVLEFPIYEVSVRGSVDTPSAARGIDIQGNLAYVADGYSGVQIIDITDPDAPAIIGSYNTSGYAYQVQVVGDYAFVADWEHGLDILNVQYPTSPVLVSNVPTNNANLGLVVKGDHVYIADGGGGLRIVDVSDPGLPTLVSTVDIDAGSRLDVAGDVAYLAAGDQGLVIFDISDVTDPVQIGAYDTPGSASDVVIAGTHAYVADNDGGLQVIDITDPTSPFLAGALASAGETRGITVAGNWAYLNRGALDLQIIDVSDPDFPVLHDSVDLPGACYDVALHGNTAFVVALTGGFYALAAAERKPISNAHDDIATNGEARDVVVSGDLAYVADGSVGFGIYDITDPTDPVLRDDIPSWSDAVALDVDGDLALVLEATTGLKAYDVSDPDGIGYTWGNSAVSGVDVAIDGDRAYVVDPTAGLRILDVTDTGIVTILATLPLAGEPRRIATDGDVVYVACGSQGLASVDVSDPTAPFLMDTYTGSSAAGDVVLYGDYAFVSDEPTVLKIVDISDPYALFEDGAYENTFWAGAVDLALDGDLLVAFTVFGGYMTLDVSDPTDPQPYGGALGGGPVYTGAAFAGDHFFGCNGNLHVSLIRQRHVNSSAGKAVSLTYPTSGRDIIRFRTFSGQSGGASFGAYSYGDPGLYTPTDSTWTRTLYPLAGQIGFVAFLDWSERTVVDWLDLQWLEDSSVIHTISDVPEDQGGRLYIDVVRSGYDFADEPDLPVTQYGVWRLVDDEALARAVGERAAADPTMPGVLAAEIDGDRYVTGLRGTFPDGTWALVSSIPAVQQDHYLAEIPTVADSTDAGIAWSTFVVTTHTITPSEWFVTLPESGYSTDDLAPSMPTSLVAGYQPGGVDLDWDDAPENDFRTFRVFRGESADFVPSSENLIAETAASAWTDAIDDPSSFHYKVAAVDHAGNESEAAAAAGPVGVPDAATAFLLAAAVPNPFNPATTISYSIPTAGRVELTVYDLSGHAVATLVSGHQTAGEHSVRWQGQDAAGNRVSSGVYLYRMISGGFTETKRMTLVK